MVVGEMVALLGHQHPRANNGGPLLNKSGKVIGIVRAKSPNENLNYGLPIERMVNAKDNVALLDSKVRYQLDIFEEKQPGRLNESGLPMDFADFNSTCQKTWHRCSTIACWQTSFSAMLRQSFRKARTFRRAAAHH